MYGIKKPEAEERAKKYLEKVGYLKNLTTTLLSSEVKTSAIARALAVEPASSFDELTSALDPELVGEVLKVMKDLANEVKHAHHPHG